MPDIWISLHYTHFEMLFNGLGGGCRRRVYTYLYNQNMYYMYVEVGF